MIRRLPAAATLAVLLLAVPAQAEPAGDPSVKRRLEAQSIKYAIDKDGDFKVTYNYRKEGRTQLVFVSGRTETVGGVPVREVFAPAAKADALDGAKALDLLRASRRAKLGSWEIGGDYLYFVIKLPDTVSAKQLEAAMDVAAEVADNKELDLTGERDEF
ncbi:hypothetical protein [Novosphingobium sp.]|jgi:hypothetical protein|uniref:hypothetical protein n=1 Tax=Novosphingobium sp. TaxID=1874826 RepID=UPI001EC08C30|nr:hypothetical protein [Novosphingobium sp.]MBK6802774.1 hypothetical protein [Novosphingobium sp.]MBK9012378.1 hypothetical protein [Novosphingobium sp.]